MPASMGSTPRVASPGARIILRVAGRCAGSRTAPLPLLVGRQAPHRGVSTCGQGTSGRPLLPSGRARVAAPPTRAGPASMSGSSPESGGGAGSRPDVSSLPEQQAPSAAGGNGATNPSEAHKPPAESGPPMPSATEALNSLGSEKSKKEESGIPHRWQVVFMIAAAFVLSNLDKVNTSVAIGPMARELGWSGLQRGLVSSAFFWGYALTQVPGGYISTKIGGAKVLSAGVALWSVGTLLAPPCAQMSLLALCASRVLVGLGEGVAPSSATSILAKTMPPTERSRAVSLVWGGMDVGSVLGLLLCGPMIKAFGWPSVFYVFAGLGLLWCALWPMFKPDNVEPVDQTRIQSEMSIMESIELPVEVKPPEKVHVPWGAIMRSMPVWAVTVAHFSFNWGYYTLLAWLPSYFELALGLEVDKSSFLTLIPYMAMTLMMPLVGPLADGMVERGVKLTAVRKIMQGIAFVGPAACMIVCGMLTPPLGAAATPPTLVLVALLSLSFAFSAFSRGGLYCNHQDLSPKYAGALLGITNTAGALPGVLGVTAAGYFLDATGSWSAALFFPAAFCQISGFLFYTIFASSERQSWS
uniref:Major facilitator superfamily (MFS) profile domain-containing protein n=1 Tax=Chlamydomonas euryale TaxID=1486919 RepID=A0A7R9YQ47_9CHLO|mmetsp:Transcript_10223/g.30846  ORF Transcript_10223/g.30846 Transcript_10223/m.30846 type:complete len:583 (+) Transcript_10223:364-2112(+)